MGFQLPDFDPAKRVFGIWDEFKAFAFKGNVIDLAVGVIIGTAFSNIINSLVKNVLMPIVGAITGTGGDKPADWADKLVWETGRGPVPYGMFLADLLNFLLIAFVLFLIIRKLLAWVLSFKRQQAAEPPPPPADVQLLTEIRDLLKAQATP